MRFTHHAAAAAVFLLVGATAVHAQVAVHGRVIEDASEQPIAGAVVELQDARGRLIERQVTDELGRFRFVVEGRGQIRLEAERIGYQRNTTPILDFRDYSTFLVEMRLDISAVLVAPLEVLARSRARVSPTLAGFERRRETGTGWYITRDDIERRGPHQVSDMLTQIPGVWFRGVGPINRRVVYMSRVANCPAEIFVDGFHMNRPGAGPGAALSPAEAFPIDELVTPATVHGIEVYHGASRVPLEFRTADVACGVVAIWTRRGGGG